MTIEVYIGPHKVEAMLDTGARPSVIDISTAHRLGLPIIPAVRRVYSLCNNSVRVNGYVEAMVQVGGRSPVMERIEVLDSDEPTLLLGRRFMEQLGQVTFDWVNGRVRFGRSWITVHKTLSGATPLARARVAKQDEPVVATISAGIDTMICTKLTPEEKETLGQLTRDFKRVFALHPKRPVRCLIDEPHRIQTDNAAPQRSRPRRVPLHWEPEISRQLEEILAADPPICRPSNSPWSSDIVLVQKRDGTLRFAVDYRRLNAVTKRDEYSLTNPQSIFDRLAGNRYFSKLDVAAAFWSIPVHPGDIEKTAFQTPRGLHEMNVMPFGLCNAQATFQRVMDRTLGNIPNCESYVDDILIYSPTFEAHIQHIKAVFNRLGESGLLLRRDKCKLGHRSIEFLGHKIAEEGRSPVPEYLERLKSFSVPRTLTELQGFIGTANYYRCYIEDMSLIGQPLYSLLRKGKVWNWDAACQKAFEELRTRLVREPVSLAHPKWNKEFYVEADASSTGVAAILSQLDENTRKLRPIQFFSSALSSSQKNYSAGQLEAWALIAATRKWSVYLKGAPSIVLLIDHCPLQWLQTQKDPKRTYARWLMELQELPFRISYRPGRENVVADYLSRCPAMNLDEEVNHEVFEEKIFHTMGPEDLYERIGDQQLQDGTVRTVLEQLRRVT